MAEIIPFRSIHCNTELVPLEKMIAPPYDVLSDTDRKQLQERNPYNIVRLILSEERPDDTPGSDKYSRAAEFLEQALTSGSYIQDDVPSVYEYVQQFPHPLNQHQTVERTTLLTALTLEPYSKGVVLPHEETLSKAKADRLNLMRATGANPEPIYGLYEDAENYVVNLLRTSRGSSKPILDAEYTGPGALHPEKHTVYQHSDPEVISKIKAFFEPLRIWIADGHHRYETALNYQREQREVLGNDIPVKPFDSILIGLSAFEDTGIVVLPTHRLVNEIDTELLLSLEDRLSPYFDIAAIPASEAANWIAQQSHGVKRFVVGLKDRTLALTLKGSSIPKDVECGEHCEAWRALDVSILQVLVLDMGLGIRWNDLASTNAIAYTRDASEALAKAASGECQVACLLQDPSVTDLLDVAVAGDKMPQKSTFFYPKLYSGLVIRSLK